MRRRGLAAIDHEFPADDADCCAVCRHIKPPCACEEQDEEWLRRMMLVLARNLRDAACCALAYQTGCDVGDDPHARGDYDYWHSGCGRPAPGWSR